MCRERERERLREREREREIERERETEREREREREKERERERKNIKFRTHRSIWNRVHNNPHRKNPKPPKLLGLPCSGIVRGGNDCARFRAEAGLQAVEGFRGKTSSLAVAKIWELNHPVLASALSSSIIITIIFVIILIRVIPQSPS